MSAPHADRDRSEPADRDADNVPRVEERVREMAEAIHQATCPRRSECSVGPGSREFDAARARACVAVEERRTAALVAERDHFQREVEEHNATCSDLDDRLADAEAKVARVEAALAELENAASEHRAMSQLSSNRAHLPMASALTRATRRVRDALRGPEPTEDGAP